MTFSLHNVAENLQKRGMQAKVYESRDAACEAIVSMLQNARSISRGGSVTLEQIGLIQRIYDLKLPFRDYRLPEDRKASLTAEYYLTGCNAITEQGELVNIDGAGNRVAALAYGPEKVIVVAGRNKIVADVDAGLERIRTIAAPLNAKRLNRNTPCVQTGRCMDCKSPDRICRVISVVTHPVPERIFVFLINEDLGF